MKLAPKADPIQKEIGKWLNNNRIIIVVLRSSNNIMTIIMARLSNDFYVESIYYVYMQLQI